jgi:phage virion morphogenesis protein
VRIEVDDRALRGRLEAMAQRVANPRAVLDDIGALLESRVQQRFDFKRDPAGVGWKAWAESTAFQRAKEGRGELLIHGGKRSQHLRDTLNHQVTGDSVLVGFGADYAAFHEFGTRRMPRRGLLLANPETGTLGEADARSVLNLLKEYLD